MVNKLGQFNREKTPERVVHARGMTAKGYFEVSHLLHTRDQVSVVRDRFK